MSVFLKEGCEGEYRRSIYHEDIDLSAPLQTYKYIYICAHICIHTHIYTYVYIYVTVFTENVVLHMWQPGFNLVKVAT